MPSPEVMGDLNAFAAGLGEAVTGLYAVGSVALDDYHHGMSNLDLIAVADQWAPDAGARVARAASKLDRPGRPTLVACLTWEGLRTPPELATVPCYRRRTQVAADELVNAFTWQILRTAAVSVQGPDYPDLWSGDVRDWARARLTGPWREWLAGPARRWATLDRRHNANFRLTTSDVVLENARLLTAWRTGRVVSKSEAGAAVIDGASSRAQRVLRDSVGYRQGQHTSMYWGPFERKFDALNFVRAAVAEASEADR